MAGLVGLGAGVSPPGQAAQCSATVLAEAPLTDAWGFLILPATIGASPVSLLLDTGAEAGFVTAAAAARLGLPLEPAATGLVQGTGGEAARPLVTLRGLSIGGVAMPARPVPVGNLPSSPIVTPPVAGLLGADLLEAGDADIDLPAHRLTLLRRNGECDGVAPWPGAASLPIELSRGRPIATVTLDGHRLRALIDTGARSIILDTRAALRIGVSAAALGRDAGGVSGGMDLRPLAYHWHRFRNLTVGQAVLRDPVLTVTPIDEQADMLLGADFFAGRRVWLSYAKQRMFFDVNARDGNAQNVSVR